LRVPVDHQTIDHRERGWDRAKKITSRHPRFSFKTPKAI
jgi:hypothetical protein